MPNFRAQKFSALQFLKYSTGLHRKLNTGTLGAPMRGPNFGTFWLLVKDLFTAHKKVDR